jgi:hypothetical protein
MFINLRKGKKKKTSNMYRRECINILFNDIQMLAAAAAFFYSGHIGLRAQLFILGGTCVLGTGLFCHVIRRQKH